jgi:hypothetical protein
MIGSSLFRVVLTSSSSSSGAGGAQGSSAQKVARIPLYLHLIATAAMGFITLFLSNKLFVYIMFLVFEATTGVFYPSYGMIKSEKIPEDIRSAAMGVLRIPLNIFVVLLLLKFKYLSSETVLSVCTLAHAVSFICYGYFYWTIKESSDSDSEGRREPSDENLDEEQLIRNK